MPDVVAMALVRLDRFLADGQQDSWDGRWSGSVLSPLILQRFLPPAHPDTISVRSAGKDHQTHLAGAYK